MKHLFLTSRITDVVGDIAVKLGDQIKNPGVYITTSFAYKKGVVQDWQVEYRASLVNAGFNLVDYDITGKTNREIELDLSPYQLMYVEGGNTAYLLKQAQQNQFGEYVKKRVEEGMIYLASSAGSVIAGPDISSADRPGKTAKDYGLNDVVGFGLVDFVVMPHWGQADKKGAYIDYKMPNSYRDDYPYILLANHQYVEVTDSLYKIIDTTN